MGRRLEVGWFMPVRSQARKLLLCVLVPLPQPLKQAAYRHLLGWRIGKRVRIGLSYLDSRSVTIGDDVAIGHFNVVRNVKRLSIGSGTILANFNSVFGSTYGPEFPGDVSIGAGVSFMSHHFVDATGSVLIGDRAVIGGRDTHFWSHEMQQSDGASRLAATRVEVGAGAYVGARAMLVGCRIPAGAVVGAGSVVTKDFAPEAARLLIAGNPASIRKRYPLDIGNQADTVETTAGDEGSGAL